MGFRRRDFPFQPRHQSAETDGRAMPVVSFFSGFRTAERSGEDGATKEKGNDTTAAAVRQTPVVDSFLPRLRPDVWVRLCFLSAGIFVS